MGGGDLNMKKSWHPGLIKNRAQVWEDQHAALQERKRMEALKKEIEEERAANELQRLNEANGGAKRQERVEFLYAGPGGGNAINEDREAYLLGKKRIDDVFGKDSITPNAAQNKGPEVKIGTGVNLRDVTTKVALDPLLAIKKQEAAQYEAMVNKKKAELEAAARKQARRDARKHRSGDSSHARREEHSYRATDHHETDYRRPRERRHASRSRSRSRDSRRRRRDDSTYEHKHYSERHTNSTSHRRRERSPSYSDSVSDDTRPDRRHEYRRISSSNRRRDDDRRTIASPRARSRSPQPRRGKSGDRVSYKARESADLPVAAGITSTATEEGLDDELRRAAKLAEMSSSARDLDQDRLRRLELSKAKDDEIRARETDDRIRGAMKPSNFVRDMQLSAGLVR